MSRLGAAARRLLIAERITMAAWARWNGWTDGKWRGDTCGCPDDRCIGYHHEHDVACGCLAVLVLDYARQATTPRGVPHFLDDGTVPGWPYRCWMCGQEWRRGPLATSSCPAWSD